MSSQGPVTIVIDYIKQNLQSLLQSMNLFMANKEKTC